MTVIAEDTGVNSSKRSPYFHPNPEWLSMKPGEELIGHQPETVYPFAVCEGLDVTLRRFPLSVPLAELSWQ